MSNWHHAPDSAEQFDEGGGAAGIHFGGYGSVLQLKNAYLHVFMNMFK